MFLLRYVTLKKKPYQARLCIRLLPPHPPRDTFIVLGDCNATPDTKKAGYELCFSPYGSRTKNIDSYPWTLQDREDCGLLFPCSMDSSLAAVIGITIWRCDKGNWSFRLYSLRGSFSIWLSALNSSLPTTDLLLQNWRLVSGPKNNIEKLRKHARALKYEVTISKRFEVVGTPKDFINWNIFNCWGVHTTSKVDKWSFL